MNRVALFLFAPGLCAWGRNGPPEARAEKNVRVVDYDDLLRRNGLRYLPNEGRPFTGEGGTASLRMPIPDPRG